MKKSLLIIFLLIFIIQPVNAVEADDSIDDIIKQNFNTGESSLPKLPKTSPKPVEPDTFLDNLREKTPSKEIRYNTVTKEIEKPTINNNVPKVPQKITSKTTKASPGKLIKVKTNTTLTDNLRKGAVVSFITQAPIVTKKTTVPAGALIRGVVVNSHTPQMFGNGGLLSIKAESISYQGKFAYLEGNIIAINHQLVLFNNIKGNNGYLKAIPQSTKNARIFYNKSVKVSQKLWNSPGFFIAPVTYLPGALFLTGSTLFSPVTAIFYKGEKVSISKGTSATIILTAPLYLEY